jgi:hypothetical protein
MIQYLLILIAVFSNGIAWYGTLVWGFRMEAFMFGMFISSLALFVALVLAVSDLIGNRSK